jgi:bifunctional UDP-N-acetylglucosamine pyrophosphorylase/glucosamine-1-phosphate N-acetyltransferase
MNELRKDISSYSPLGVIILAAGKGTRMSSEVPKVLHRVAGRAMIRQVLDTVEILSPERVVVVIGPQMEKVKAISQPHTTVVQEEQLGTAHAVMQARSALDGFEGDILVVFGDTPLITSDTIRLMQQSLDGHDGNSVAVLGFHLENPTGYGRLRCSEDGSVEAIVEDLDATAEELQITLCNSGVMGFKSKILFRILDKIGNQNAKGEYYLTDLVSLCRNIGGRVGLVEGRGEELQGINSRADLARAEAVMQDRLRARAMASGVTLVDPSSTWLSMDTSFGKDVTVGPNVYFGQSVEVGDDVEIEAFSHLEGVRLVRGSAVGPFARLRPGTVIGAGAKIGNFVEIKASQVGEGSKISHLTYIGNSQVGDRVNIGAGTITCNYDGLEKHQTDIGDGAFIGSNTALVAPVSVGARAIIGAGSVVTDDVDAEELSVTRAEQKHLKGGAQRWRRRRSPERS